MLKPKTPKTKKRKSQSTHCDSKRILQAISILKQLNQKYYENKEKKSLLEDESENPIILQLTMKKIPPPMMQKFIKVHLPKSILTDKHEVCLITGDLDKRNTKAEVEPDVLHFKELLKKENISQVNEVITLRQLRKEYKPFEARRKLCGAYDVFLCDKKIAGVLPHTLGKCFFKKRRLPIQINMQTPKLKEQIEKALSSTVFHIACRGNSCASEVANLTMQDEDILSNVKSSIDALQEQLPGQWDNVLGIYVKTPKSKAIPLYMSNDDPNDFNFTKTRTRPKGVTAELSTLPNAEVKVFRDGRVTVKKCEDSDDSSEMETNSSGFNDFVKQNEEQIEEKSFPTTANVEEVGSEERKKEKKSKKRKSNLGSIENASESKVEEKKINNSEIEEPEKKSKKRKSSSNVKNSNVESEKEVEDSKNENMERKNKKRKSKLELTEDSSEVAVEKEVEYLKKENSGKKNKQRKSSLSFNEGCSNDAVNEESIEAADKSKKKDKNINFYLELNEASSEVEVNIETSEAAKLKKKSRKSKFATEFNKECTEVGLEDQSIEVNIENSEAVKPKKSRKSKSTTEFNKECTEVGLEDKEKENSKIVPPKIKTKNRISDFAPNEVNTEIKTKGDIKSLSLKSLKNKRKTIN